VYENGSRELTIQVEPECLMNAFPHPACPISYGSVDTESILLAMALRGAKEPFRDDHAGPVGASFSSLELLVFLSFVLDSNSTGFPSKGQLSGFSGRDPFGYLPAYS
jgi:hypothetical protein